MKNNSCFILAAFLCMAQLSCGQRPQHIPPQQKHENMDTVKLTNATVKSAFDAWQEGDAATFLSFFTDDAKLYDDGNPRNFQSFVKEACGHEKFTTIEKVENEGRDITGKFHTESWGDFKTYFKFHFNATGKVDRLDIGQAK